MTPSAAPPRRARSIGAVAAGFVATAALSLGVDVVMHATGLFPPWGASMSDALFLLALLYRVAFTILGGYLTASLAPARPMTHVWVLGGIGVVAATVGAVATWNAAPELGPHWYPIMLIVTALPCVWAGGTLRAARAATITRRYSSASP